MATLTLPSPALLSDLERLDVPALQQRLVIADEQKKSIDMQTLKIRLRIEELTPRREPVAVAADPVTPPSLFDIDELMSEDKEYDEAFEPSELDIQRKQNQADRSNALEKQRSTVRGLQTEIANLKGIPYRIQNREEKIEALDNSISSAITFGWWNKKSRKNLVEDRNDLEEQFTKQPLALEQKSSELELANLSLQDLERKEPDSSYNAQLLHSLPAKRRLERTQQAILVSFDSSAGVFTLRMPRTPDEMDFPRTVKLSFNKRNQDMEFARILGLSVSTKYSDMNTVEDSVDLNFDFTDELIPFGLEVVEVNGQEQLRMPEAILKQFGANIIL